MENYRVLEKIGEGSFGQVFKGRRKFSGQVVALKFIPKGGQSAKELRCLKREIEIMQKLKHPNIVLLLDSFDTETKVVVVTEYAEGQLYQILEDDGCLPEGQVHEIACQLVSALYYLHSHRILHRDMKPQNILLGKGGVVKLCDFGFARVMSVSTLVLTSVKGTPLYMSPELVEEKPYDHTADLWSLGCILYELHTGSPPFCTKSIFHLVHLIVKDPVKWPENMSQECMSFLKGLLIKDPQTRLSWPGLLYHPFIAHGVKVLPDEGLCSPLTITPSPVVQALKQQQAAEKSARSGESKTRDLHEKTQKQNQDQSKTRKAFPTTQSPTISAPSDYAPTSHHSLDSTFTVCQNSAHPPANQHQADDIGVARVKLAPCKGPISTDYEREFPSVDVGPRLEVLKGHSRPGHNSLTSVKLDSDEQDVNSDEEWQQLAEVTDHMSVPMDPHIHQKLKNKFLRCREQILNQKLEEPSTILQPLKLLATIILPFDPTDARRIGEEIDWLHVLFSLTEVMLRSPDLMKKPWSERVLAELTAVLLPIWENQPDWQIVERAHDFCQLLTSLFLHPVPNVLAPQAAALLSLFVHHNVCVDIHMHKLTALLENLLTEPEKPHYPLPPGWGRCDGVLVLILYFLYESDSSALYDFLKSEVWCHLWTKVANILESTAAKPDFLSVDGFHILLSIVMFAFSNEPHECLSLFFDDDKKLIRILTRLLMTHSSAPLKRGLLWGGFDMNSLALMSCQLLCFPFAAELPPEKIEAILQSYQSLNIVESLVQVIQFQSPAVLELPLSLLRRLCLSSPMYALPSFITAAQDCGFLPPSASLDQGLNELNQSGNAAEQTRSNVTPHKKLSKIKRIFGYQPTRTTGIIEGSINERRDTRDPPNMHHQLSKSKSGSVRGKGFYSKIKQHVNRFSMKHLRDSIEQQSDAVEEPLDSLKFHKGFSHHLRHHAACKKSNESRFIDSLEQPMNSVGHTTVIKGSPKPLEVEGQPHQPGFRTASYLLSMLLQSESLSGCAVQLLSLLCHIYSPGSAFSAIPVDPVVLRAALHHFDDGVRAAVCNLLTCLKPDLGQDSPRSNAGPNWTIEPAVFKDLLRYLSDSAPSVRRSACKAAVKWLGMMEKVTSKRNRHLQITEGSRRTVNAPAVTEKERMKVGGIREQLKDDAGSSLSCVGTSIEGEKWLKVAMEAVSPAVSLLSDSDAVIRRQGCIILGSVAAITGGERALMIKDAPRQLLHLAHTDTHHAVRQQALAAICTFNQQDTL